MRLVSATKWVGVIFVIASIIAGFLIYPKLEIVTGYAAKKACSCAFVGGHSVDQIESYDLEAFPLSLASLNIDKDRLEVTASILGLQKKTAILRKGLGCALLQGEDDYNIERSSALYKKTVSPKNSKAPAPTPSKSLSLAFDKTGQWEKKTFAMVVMKDGNIVEERYHPGYDANTKLLGWSMTKSVANLIVGSLVKEGRLTLDIDSLYPAWHNDERAQVTLAHLLKMNSGLEWTEQYGNISDITQGLFLEEDFISYVRSKPAESIPGSEWEYASGTTNLISGIVRRQFESYQDYLDYPHNKIFKVLGLDNPVIETDEAGHYILSSYMWAKARDWGKLGQLYLNKGNWKGEQLIDTSYIEWSTKAHSASNEYGAHLWLNTDQSDYPSAPSTMYWFSGYEGQYVFIIPEDDLVIVRLGLSKGPPFDMNAVLAEVIQNHS